MNIRATLRLALQALIRNKARSLLTMLGIVIGVAAVIVTVAIGTGARVQVQNSINALGSNLIVVQPGSVTTTGARGGLGVRLATQEYLDKKAAKDKGEGEAAGQITNSKPN